LRSGIIAVREFLRADEVTGRAEKACPIEGFCLNYSQQLFFNRPPSFLLCVTVPPALLFWDSTPRGTASAGKMLRDRFRLSNSTPAVGNS
jgi:hypothetical protein